MGGELDFNKATWKKWGKGDEIFEAIYRIYIYNMP